MFLVYLRIFPKQKHDFTPNKSNKLIFTLDLRSLKQEKDR